MLLKNAERAVIDVHKIADYALNPDHPVGRHKARVFAASLGFDRSNVHLLIEEIRRGVVAHAAEPGRVDEYGARYRVDIPVAPRGWPSSAQRGSTGQGAMSRSSSPSTSADPRLAVGQAAYLREPLPECGLERGAIGAVVMVFTRPRLAYEVEFVDTAGETRALATLQPEQICASLSLGSGVRKSQ